MSCDGYETGSAFQVRESITPRSLNRSMRNSDGDLPTFGEAVSLSEESNFLRVSMNVTTRSRLGTGRSGVVVRTMHDSDDNHLMLVQSGASFFLLSNSQIQKIGPIDQAGEKS